MLRKTSAVKYTAVFALLSVAILCAAPSTSPATQSASAFRDLVRSFIDREMRLSPESATEDGDHRFDDRLSDLSAAGIRTRIEHARRWKARFANWRGALPAADQADREWLAAHLDGELLWFEEVKF